MREQRIHVELHQLVTGNAEILGIGIFRLLADRIEKCLGTVQSFLSAKRKI